MNSSASEFGKDLGVMHELAITGRKVGMTAEDWGRMAHDEKLLKGIFNVLHGYAEIKTIEYPIDFDANPSVPDRWTILPDSEQLPNRVRGQIKFNPSKVRLYLDGNQKNGSIEGNKLLKKLTKEPVYGAQLLDFYLANPHLIPDEWKGKAVFFWGTIYRNAGDGSCVRYLFWGRGSWRWNCHRLADDWHGYDPALVFGK